MKPPPSAVHAFALTVGKGARYDMLMTGSGSTAVESTADGRAESRLGKSCAALIEGRLESQLESNAVTQRAVVRVKSERVMDARPSKNEWWRLVPPAWLFGSYLWDAVLGDLYRRGGNLEIARQHSERALGSAPTEAVRQLLRRRLAMPT